jgi:hypothetical protein
MTLDVQTDGQDAKVLEIKPRTVVQWEKTNRGRSAAQLTGDTMLTYLYELAWLALGSPGDFAGFCATTDVTYAQNEGEATGPDPTPPVQSTDS